MSQSFSNTIPIYMQLVERINRSIVRQELKAGDKLPSVRDLAVQVGVNPNTVQRAYRELELMGTVTTKRGQGTFVTEDEEVLQRLRETMKEAYISEFVRDMKEMGFREEEIVGGLRAYLDKAEEETT